MSRVGNVASVGGKAISATASIVAEATKKVAFVTTALSAGAVIGTKAMIDQAASMEQYRNTLNVVMKDQKKAGETFAWAVQFANKTPFETDEIVQATVKLQSYGLEAKKTMPFIGDMAAAMGKGVDQAVEAVADAQTGELERLKEFGITKAMIVEQANKRLKGIEVVNQQGQITDQKAFNLAMFSLMQERYKGGMETQAKTFRGIMSTITGVWKSGLAEMAGISQTGDIIKGSLFDRIKQKAQGVGDVMSKLQSNGVFQKIGEVIGNVSGKVFGFIDRIGPKVMQVASQLAPVIGKIFDLMGNSPILPAILDIIMQLAPLLTDFASSIMPSLMSILKALGDVFQDIIPVLINVAKDIFPVFAEVIKVVADGIKELLPVVSMIAKSILPILANVIKAVSAAIKPLIPVLVQIVQQIAPLLQKFFTSFNSLIVKLLPVIQFLAQVISISLKVAFEALSPVIQFVINRVTGLIDRLSSIISFITNVFTGDWAAAWQNVKDIFGNIFSGLAELLKAPINAVIGLINGAIEGINSVSIDIPDWVPEWAGGGEHLGFNMGKLPLLAKGGLANRPSIAGEAGPEMVIPLKPKNPRSISLLQQTAKVLGIGGSKGGGNTYVFSPVIHGGSAAEVKEVLEDEYEKFKAWIERYKHEEERVSFSG